MFSSYTNIYVRQILQSWSQSMQSLEVLYMFDKELSNVPW